MDIKEQLDLSGKIIIKVQLANDIRRIPIHNDAITYDELVLMMQRIFNGKLSASDDITIKYKDEDGDLITINDSSDLSFAIQCSRVLKLNILMDTESANASHETKTTVLKQTEMIGFKQQLQSIRDQVNKLLDSLDVAPMPSSTNTEQTSEQPSSDVVAPSSDNFVNKVNPSEFDPLQDKKPVEKEVQQAPQNNHETPENRPQSVPVVPPPISAANQNPHVEFYGRTPVSGYQVTYPYPQQYSYSQGGFIQQTDQGHVQQNPNVYVNTSQANAMQYAPQSQQQQQPYNPPSLGAYSTGPPVNPYSKNYTQPSPQHGYMQPR